MKIAILTSDTDSFEKPMAQGLKRILDKLGINSRIFWKGHSILGKVHPRLELTSDGLRNQYHNMLKLLATTELVFYDVIVVVGTVATAFLKECHPFIETLRRIFPNKPIVLYSTSYLATRNWLFRNIKRESVNNFGMERYDYYLTASVVSENPMPGGENPVCVVGLNLEDPSLRVDPGRDFLALLDFERSAHMKERAIMIRALEDTDTKYVVLNRHYKMDEIRSIYRTVSVYFLAHRESFGLPISELQACGAYVFAPFSNWAPSYWMKDDLYAEGEGRLSSNFVIYENDPDLLKQKLREIKSSHDPFKVAADFVRQYPQFYYGDLGQVKEFLQKIEAGIITGRSHREYEPLNEKIINGFEATNSARTSGASAPSDHRSPRPSPGSTKRQIVTPDGERAGMPG